jgi:hypothetical protein
MSRQRNTDNSRHMMRNMLPTRDIMNITQTRVECNVKSPLWCRVDSWENSITVINMKHYQWHINQLLPDSKRSVPCMWLNRLQNRVKWRRMHYGICKNILICGNKKKLCKYVFLQHRDKKSSTKIPDLKKRSDTTCLIKNHLYQFIYRFL